MDAQLCVTIAFFVLLSKNTKIFPLILQSIPRTHLKTTEKYGGEHFPQENMNAAMLEHTHNKNCGLLTKEKLLLSNHKFKLTIKN